MILINKRNEIDDKLSLANNNGYSMLIYVAVVDLYFIFI